MAEEGAVESVEIGRFRPGLHCDPADKHIKM